MTGHFGLWIGLSLAATGWALAFGAPVGVCLIAIGLAWTPVVSGALFARGLSELGRLELEVGLWIAAAVGAVASTGGATSPHVLWFVPPLMLAAVRGDTRLRLETAGFALAGFGIAALAGVDGGWVPAREAWVLGVGYGAALLVLSSLIGLQSPAAVQWRRARRERVSSGEAAQRSPEASSAAGERAVDPAIERLSNAAEAASQRADEAETRLASRMLFLAQTSHELRTPLNAIVGFADMMVQQVFGALPEKYLEYARLIREGGRHLNAVVDDVTDLAKIEAGKFEIQTEVVSLNDLLDEAVHFLADTAERKKVTLRLDETGDVEATADPRAVRQIAYNLISNALKFTPAGGQVIVSAVEDAAGARMVVTDNGVGITPDELRELSNAFRQGRAGKAQKGSGLGLSVVRAYVDLHDGELTMSGQPGQGTVVSVFFPAQPQAVEKGGDGA